jgi:uncharacterized phage-like protein YoqJ
MIVGTTGHRTLQHPEKELAEGIAKIFGRLKPKRVITWMALGWDILVASVCVAMEIPFVAAVPFKGQEQRWTKEQRKRYTELLTLAESITIISEGGYETWKLFRRNVWIVENCDALISYADPAKIASGSSGSVHCYQEGLKRLGPGRVKNFWPNL